MNYRINTIYQLKPILIGFRKSQNLSQSQMALRLGVTQQTYQVLESAPERVTMERLFRVLAILGVKLELLESKDPTQNNELSSKKKSFMRLYTKPKSIMRKESRNEKW